MLKNAKLFSVDNFNIDAKNLLNEKKEELKDRIELSLNYSTNRCRTKSLNL
jgi:hypothetical protein